MAHWTVQLAMLNLAESIRRLPEGPLEQRMRSAFLQATERLGTVGYLSPRKWDVSASDQEVSLWGLMQGHRVTAAVLRCIDDVGFEVRILVDGQVKETRLFPGENGSEKARAFAALKRAELQPGSGPQGDREAGAWVR